MGVSYSQGCTPNSWQSFIGQSKGFLIHQNLGGFHSVQTYPCTHASTISWWFQTCLVFHIAVRWRSQLTSILFRGGGSATSRICFTIPMNCQCSPIAIGNWLFGQEGPKFPLCILVIIFYPWHLQQGFCGVPQFYLQETVVLFHPMFDGEWPAAEK